MEALGSSSLVCSSFRSSSRRQRRIQATLQIPKTPSNFLSLPTLPAGDLVEEPNLRTGYTARTSTQIEACPFIPIVPTTTITSTTATRDDEGISSANSVAISELYAIMEAVADRAEMHANIEEQRNNWNHLLLTSINTMTMAAATMTGLASTSGMGAPLVGLKLSSTLLYLGATGLLLVMNKIQPSQLAEEQRNAARLFKQLHGQIRTTLALGTPTPMDVKDAMEKVLSLDKAYPLPLLGAMLDKFPESVEPAVWWPQQRQRGPGGNVERNGWTKKLEEEMKQIVGVLKRMDSAEYLRLANVALKMNRILAITGPLLTALGAIGSAFVGSPNATWAVLLGVIAGALASVVNTLEHGGQVGMVFEMYRSSAGFFRLMQESVEATLKEKVEKRENGELFEIKVALQLGRSLSELRDLASLSSSRGNKKTTEEFASKLF